METKTKDQQELLVDPDQKPAKLPAVRGRNKLQAQDAAPAAPQPTTQQPTTPMDLLRIVTERGASVEEISKFMDLMERQEAKQAKQAYDAAFADFKLEVPEIVKDARANFEARGQTVEYGHATLGHICDRLLVALAKHGFAHRWAPQQPGDGMIAVTCVLTHRQGHSEHATVQYPPDPSGSKNGQQAINSSLTYGERTSLLAVCGVGVKEQNDDDGHGGQQEATLAEKWIAKVSMATTDEAVVEVWKEGIVVIEKAKDRVAYAAFKNAVAARRAELAKGAR